MEGLRALPAVRAYALVGAFVVGTGAYFFMAFKGHWGEALGAVFLQVLLVNVVLTDVAREARRAANLAAAGLGLLALGAGILVGFLA